jgi:hypothetical protein
LYSSSSRPTQFSFIRSLVRMPRLIRPHIPRAYSSCPT